VDVPNDMVLPVLVDLACSFGDEENEIPELLFGKGALVYRAGLEFLLQGLGIDALVVTDEDA
jgi:hypothetical protein